MTALTPQGLVPSWSGAPATLHNQEGDTIPGGGASASGVSANTIRATNHQTGFTYQITAGALPPGVTMDSTGVLSGSFTNSAPDTNNGSAGTFAITVRATNGSNSANYNLTWKVSRFRKGDIFAGIGRGRYQVFSEAGVYKYTVQSETQSQWEADDVNNWGNQGYTTGCGYNWKSRKMYFTSYDLDDRPNVNVIDPVPANNSSVSTSAFPREYLSTRRDPGLEPGKSGTPDPDNRSVDNAPESVVFDNEGSMYVGHAGGYYMINGNGDWLRGTSGDLAVLDTSNRYLDASGSLVLSNGQPVFFPKGVSKTNLLENWADPAGNDAGALPGSPQALIQWGRDIQKFAYNATTGAMTRTNIYPTYAAYQGSDWVDLASDQSTVFYTSEWGAVYRYNVAAGVPDEDRQLSDFTVLPPGNGQSQTLYALRLLPPGDGSAGLLVASKSEVLRLNSSGQVVMRYDMPNVDGWFALNISPDGRYVYSASIATGRVYKWEISSGRPAQLGPLPADQGLQTNADPEGVRFTLDGLCVMGEYTAAQEECGNGEDDDGDGLVDETCTPIEVCSNISPGDDDLDGLVDTNDPDCGATNICAASGYTDSTVPGFCSRHNFEGDVVTLQPAPGANSPTIVDTYDIRGLEVATNQAGLPPGITANANGTLTGVPPYSMILNTAIPLTRTWTITVDVTRRDTARPGSPIIAEYTQQFDWTIENRNRPPVATNQARVTRPGTPVTLDVLAADPPSLGTAAADSDPDVEDTLTVTGTSAPVNGGTLTRTGGSVTYTPPASMISGGSDNFTYTISDGRGGTATATVTITTANGAPEARPDFAVTRPGRPVAIPVLTNDVDPDASDTISFVRILPDEQPRQGSITVASGIVTYTPVITATTDLSFDDSFGYEITDGSGATARARVTVDIINSPPVGGPDFAFARPGNTVAIPVLANDTDPDAPPTPAAPDTLTIIDNSNPLHGTISLSGNVFSYTPNPGWLGMDPFAYTISDGFGGTTIVRVEVTTVNRPPDAVDDTVTVRPGQAKIIAVRGNDTDPDNAPDIPPAGPDPMNIISNTAASNGTVTCTLTECTYTANPGYVGADSFRYTISDTYGGSDTATVFITSVNTRPDAVDDARTTRPAVPVAVSVLDNDTDPESDPLTVTVNTNPSNGTVACTASVCTYTSNAGFTGTDTFTYTISDGFGGIDTATVTITVVNRPPVANDDTYTMIAGGTLPPFDVRANDPADPDGDSVTIVSFTQPSSGAVVRNPDGTFTFTPASGFSGVVTFVYTVRDEYGAIDTAIVTINVVNLPPIARDDAASTNGTRPVTVSVMANDNDPDNHVIAVTGATTPANGTVVVNANGTITYTANPGFQGTDTFFYTIRDGFGGESTARVTITVGPPNRFTPCTCATAKASPGELWPPNHKQVEVVNVTSLVDPDNGQPLNIRILGIYQDEPTDYLGDGDTEIDGFGVGTSSARVRAERTGNPNIPGNGRVYEIQFEATAADGSFCQGSVFTGVPHDQGQGRWIIDDGIRYDSTVAGGPVHHNALTVSANLTDSEVAASGFAARFTAQARIGGSAMTELLLGTSLTSPAASGQFTWANNQPVTFVLTRHGADTKFELATASQSTSISASIACANGQCDDLVLRAASGGTGKLRLSSLNLNGMAISQTVVVDVGGDPRSIRLSGLTLGDGATLSGIARMEWTAPAPTGNTVNFTVALGSACPPDGGSNGGGGGSGTPPLARTDRYTTAEDTLLTVAAGDGVLLNDLTFAGQLSATLVSGVSNGTLALNGNGSFTYLPNANFTGEDTFLYRVSDGTQQSDATLVTIVVTPVIDPPIALNDSASTNERTPVTIQVLGNDSDPVGGPITLVSVTQPANGKAAVSGSSVIYTPAPGFIGMDTFTYTITGAEGAATATVTVTVVNVNEPPVAVNNAYTTAEDTPLTISAPGIQANDSDPDAGDTFTSILVSAPSNGTLSLNANGSFTYTPAANFNGTDSFTYKVRDAGGLESNVATVSITITAVNDPPVAVNDSHVVTEDGVLQIASPGVKVNDSDPDTAAENLTVSLVTSTQRGSLTLNTDGSFVYTPLPNVSGADTFVYRLSDGSASSTATVTIAITESPDPPRAADDAATTPEDTAVTIAVLGNDTDPDSPTLTLQGVTQPQNGTVSIVGTQVRYVPNGNFNGADQFTYTITDGQATSTAKVVVTITPVNDPPVAQPDTYTTPLETVLNVQTPGVLTNDSDPDQQNLTVIMGSQPANGSVVMQTHGAFAYTPKKNFTGTDTFTYKVSDGVSESALTTVTITVTSANRPPVAVNDAYTTPHNTPLTVPAPGVLSNDSDPDTGNTLTVTITTSTPSSAGTTVLNADGSFTFTPTSTFTGPTTFRYRARDNHSSQSNEAIVTITVGAANRPPVAVNDSYSTDKNKALTIAAPGILANDSDPDTGNTITAVLIAGPPASAGTLTQNANGSFTFTPATNYVGTTTYTYQAKDNRDASSNTATVTIEVKDVITSGQVCYDGGATKTAYRAYLDWNILENGDVKVRATVSRNYTDNSYGINKIGWGNKNRDFGAVYRSDFGQIAFYDKTGAKKIEFRIDLLSPKAGTPSGYGSLGISPGQQADGGMVAGSAGNIVSMMTSMDLNMNGFGYVTTATNHPLKTYSPATNISYATNATYPLWIWDVWYEATVSSATFGSTGFGYPRLTGLHASPPKADVTSWRLINCQ